MVYVILLVLAFVVDVVLFGFEIPMLSPAALFLGAIVDALGKRSMTLK